MDLTVFGAFPKLRRVRLQGVTRILAFPEVLEAQVTLGVVPGTPLPAGLADRPWLRLQPRRAP